MLAMYSSVLKKDKFLKRFSDDSVEAASIANELVCDLKSLSVNSAEGKLDTSMEYLKNIENNLKIIEALTDNLKQNMNGYISSLIVQEQKEEVELPEQESVKREPEKVLQPNLNMDTRQVSDIMNAVKALKEMRDSIGEDKKV